MGLIPTETTKPKVRIEDELILIYGDPGVGKSTFCSQLDKPLFLDTEHGLNNLECYQIGIDSWEKFQEVYKELKAQKGKLPFKTIVIDTIDNLFDMCTDTMNKKLGITHESDLGFGKGYKVISREFNLALAAYRQLGLGMVYTSHAKGEEITSRVGKYTKFSPTMSASCDKVVTPACDFILFAEIAKTDDGKEARVIHTKPNTHWIAKDKTGALPETIELSAKAFIDAFEKAKTKKGETK